MVGFLVVLVIVGVIVGGSLYTAKKVSKDVSNSEELQEVAGQAENMKGVVEERSTTPEEAFIDTAAEPLDPESESTPEPTMVVPTSNGSEIEGESESVSEPTSTSDPVIQTSPLYQHVLENIYTGPESSSEQTTESEFTTPSELEPPTPQTVTVVYENSGFSPKSSTIYKGDTVVFINSSTHSMWVSSNLHPTHTLYPEKSSSDCLGSSFDSCANIPPGDLWQFEFNSTGSWGYHNHLRAGKTGIVVVQ